MAPNEHKHRIYTSSQTILVQNTALDASEGVTAKRGIREIISGKQTNCDKVG